MADQNRPVPNDTFDNESDEENEGCKLEFSPEIEDMATISSNNDDDDCGRHGDRFIETVGNDDASSLIHVLYDDTQQRGVHLTSSPSPATNTLLLPYFYGTPYEVMDSCSSVTAKGEHGESQSNYISNKMDCQVPVPSSLLSSCFDNSTLLSYGRQQQQHHQQQNNCPFIDNDDDDDDAMRDEEEAASFIVDVGHRPTTVEIPTVITGNSNDPFFQLPNTLGNTIISSSTPTTMKLNTHIALQTYGSILSCLGHCGPPIATTIYKNNNEEVLGQ